MKSAYDKYLEKAAQEWWDAYDEATTQGLIEELNKKKHDKDKRRRN